MERYLIALLIMMLPTGLLAEHNRIIPFNVQIPHMCGDTEHLLEGIRDKYKEEIVFMAPSVNEAGQELFHSLWYDPVGHTWTFVVVNKERGVTCVLASGDNAQTFVPKGKAI